MASFLARVKRAPSNLKNLDLRHGKGFLDHAIDAGEELGATYAAAYVNTRYGDRAKWRGHEITYWGGLLAKIGVVAADVLGFESPALAHVNSVAMGAIGARVAALGAAAGMRASGAALSAPSVRGELGGDVSLGYIPPAQEPNRWLNQPEIDRLAAMFAG